MDKKHAKWYYSVHAFPNKILWIIKYRWSIYDRYFSRKMVLDVNEGNFGGSQTVFGMEASRSSDWNIRVAKWASRECRRVESFRDSESHRCNFIRSIQWFVNNDTALSREPGMNTLCMRGTGLGSIVPRQNRGQNAKTRKCVFTVGKILPGFLWGETASNRCVKNLRTFSYRSIYNSSIMRYAVEL